ncbi:hypothetical protein CAEBREN_07392 [Caenorhabditis brenneri]|uniref:Uncharacterized protein n=1 Tax=Caenorhabditis brenneri TaxID=135651 RepID=G0MH89_CAEBE|nr:hypothetical protein CAEBREN_07392 [Caenorhabditis brenneri]
MNLSSSTLVGTIIDQ